MVDNSSHTEVYLPLAFPQGRSICHCDHGYTPRAPLSHQQTLRESEPVPLSKLREKKTVSIMVDSQLQQDSQPCCDPACFKKSQCQIEHVRTQSPEITYFLQKLHNFKNILILTCKIFQNEIDIYIKKSNY